MSKLTSVASKAVSRPTRVGQGDIIHRPSDETGKPRWGFIITADCDIAQDKAGARLSYLDIVTVHDYLEHVWAAEELRKLRTNFLNNAVALVNKAVQSIDDKLDDVSPDDLLTWLRDNSGEEIMESLEIPRKKIKQYVEALEAVELTFGLRGAPTTALQKLRRIWAISGAAGKKMRERLEQALDYNRATDFHLIPEIPGSKPLGYVVLLREVFSIAHRDVHSSALDLQINGETDAYHVVGTSTDNLRYAISQKMAFLFSRIGMTEDFESKCNIVTELAINHLSSLHELTGTDV